MTDEEETTEPRFELNAYWVDYVDPETDLPICDIGATRQITIQIEPPSRGSYGECAIRANEILARLAPMALRWVPAFGVLPQLRVTVDSV